MITSKRGINLIKEFEGLRLHSYRDMVNVLTIGYGHTGHDVKENQVITEDEATKLLEKDLQKFEGFVSNLVKVNLTQNQFDALVSFTYNLGAASLAGSTLLQKLNATNYQGAQDEFLKWCKAGGKVVEGLVRRRAAESKLFGEA